MLILKTIIRMQHFNKKSFHLPKYFDVLKTHAKAQKSKKKALLRVLQRSITDKKSVFLLWKDNFKNINSKYEKMPIE
jgi:hypothetical protein